MLLRGALEDSFVAEVKKGKMASKLCSNEINRFNHNGLNSRVSNLLRKHFVPSTTTTRTDRRHHHLGLK